MGDRATLIAVAYGVAVVLGLVAAAWLWGSTKAGSAVDRERLAERERAWLVVVLAILGGLLFATMFFTPYGESSSGGRKQTVRVIASQFVWRIEPALVRTDVPVEFRLDSVDVNHAFGVYGPDDALVLQVQVMPGYTQKAVHTFRRPGTYKVLCLEFCGVQHHGMVGRFEVKP